MLTVLTLALLAQGAEVKPLTPGFPFHPPAVTQGKSWLAPPAKAFSFAFQPAPGKLKEAAPVEGPAAPACAITVLKADPKLDERIARKAPLDLDPKIVRPSPCRE